MSEEQKIIDLENEISFLKDALCEKQKEIEEKTTIIMAGAKKVKQLEKEIEELQTKLAIETIDNKYNQEERDEETIPRCKIREKIKKLEDNMILFTNDKEKFNKYRYARNILQELLEEN